MQTKTIKQRADERYDEMSQLSRDIVSKLESTFDYSSPESLSHIPDIVKALQESGLEYSQRVKVADYVFLNSALHALPQACSHFASLYEKLKYSQEYTLPFFLIGGHPDRNTIDLSSEPGPYSPILKGLLRHLEEKREFKAHVYEGNTELLEDVEMFSSVALLSLAHTNHSLITSILVNSIEPVSERVNNAALDLSLSIEAAYSFIDAYSPASACKVKKGLEFFLDRYSLCTNDMAPKSLGGNYRHLLRRLMREQPNSWKNLFYGKLPEPLANRVRLLEASANERGIIEEDRIRVIEKLIQGGAAPYLSIFSDDGADMEDILVASTLTNLTQEERKTLLGINNGGKKTISKYLGMCRVPIKDSEVKYDAKKFLEACASIDPEVFQRERVVSSILKRKLISLYEPEFMSNPEGTISKLESLALQEHNPVERQLLEQGLEHFKLRVAVSKVNGVVKELVVIE